MTESGYKRGIIPAMLRVASIFTISFLINIAWSVALLVIFTMRNSSMISNDVIDQIVKSPEFLFFTSVYNVFVILTVYLFWKYSDKCSTEFIGLRWRKNSMKLFGLGIIGGSLEIGLIMLLSFALGTLWFQSYGSTSFSMTEIVKSLFYGVLAFLLVGFGEETLFRGYIQKRLMLTIGNRWALIISSLIFMAAHILTYGKLLDFIDVALGGVVLGYLYILTDSLYLPAAYHFIYDLIQVNIVKIQDYEHYKGAVMYIFSNTGDIILQGVNYGNIVEVSFVAIELVVLLLLYIFRSRIKSMADNV